MSAECRICPHHCRIEDDRLGRCRARGARNGEVVDLNYGRLTSAGLDPIEKKPLARFFPGSMILSVGSYGCNFRCGFCQNHSISMCGPDERYEYCSPEQLTNAAVRLVPEGNIGVAYTYNEPLIGYEFVRDTSRLIHEAGLKNVVVTNGFINKEPLRELLPLIDAFNIDLKAFSEEFYHRIGGRLETVKDSIRLACGTSHVEVTTLIVPGLNDSETEMEALSSWLAGVSPDIPLHITRFFPRFEMLDTEPTPVADILRLADIARQHLRYVYEGNI
ncbi:MAG: AmmeMemoRadiSam system radical SAM enzyme [Clostridia bacterium]|nr:AmmeMemoRadiSam system radical SAM enzyme [Clostridia bacterium]